MDEGYAVTLESLHVICLALMMVIKNSCVPVSFPANPQEKKYPTSFKKAPCQTLIHAIKFCSVGHLL